MRSPKIALPIIAIAVLFLGSGSSIAHHYPPVDHHANWTVYEGGDGYMQISEDDLDSDGEYTAHVYVEVIPGTGNDFCNMPLFQQPELYDSEGRTNPYNNPNPNEDYYLESCANDEGLLPLFKDRNTHLLADSNICLVEIGFVWLHHSNDNSGTYQWDSSHDLFVMDPNHEDVMPGIGTGCEDEGGFSTAAILGVVVIVIGILGGVFYWRKHGTAGVSETVSEIPNTQQSESSQPVTEKAQDVDPLEGNKSNQEVHEGGGNSNFCPNCGSANDSNGKFCKDCGTELSD